ncbi:MAG: thiamine-phosphate kinase [Pyrinomonadaceae bacterium]
MRSEFDFIKSLRNNFNLPALGDDCAVLPKDDVSDLLVSSDLLVEDIDFRLRWITPKQLGHKALAVSLSDIASMGGKPIHSLISLGVPERVWNTNFLDEFYSGYFELANKFNVELAGGDISKTPDRIVIDSTVLGEVKRGNAILRSTAKPNELIMVSGPLGGASTALELLEGGDTSPESVTQDLVATQLTPMPRVEYGKMLQENYLATAMIDISDGLSSDLKHICEASSVGAIVYADKIPVNEHLQRLKPEFPAQLDKALNGGEDFELLFTVDPRKISNKFLREFSIIGETTQTADTIELIDGDKSMNLISRGYTHF